MPYADLETAVLGRHVAPLRGLVEPLTVERDELGPTRRVLVAFMDRMSSEPADRPCQRRLAALDRPTSDRPTPRLRSRVGKSSMRGIINGVQNFQAKEEL